MNSWELYNIIGIPDIMILSLTLLFHKEYCIKAI